MRQRTSKSVAKRHDLNYFKRGSDVRLWQWRLASIAVGIALIWLGLSASRHGSAMFSQGPMSSAHAVFGQKCEACHQPVIRGAGWLPVIGARRRVPDSACLSCHVAPAHHPAQVAFTPNCGTCHVEHHGSTHLAATSDASCTQCHANLTVRSGQLNVADGIHSFVSGHPDFRALRTASEADREAAFGLKFNHADHLKKDLTGPNREGVQMVCADCHRTTADLASATWRFAGTSDAVSNASPQTMNVSYAAPPLHPVESRAQMAPATFQLSCRACHTLQFDEHITAEAPHTNPAIVQQFVVEQITAFAESHPRVVASEIKNWQQTGHLPARMPGHPPRNQQEWIAARIARSETILWREKCNLCHTVQGGQAPPTPKLVRASLASTNQTEPLPSIAPSHQPQRFYSAAVFSHEAHQAVACQECHAQALTSTTGKELLMPPVATCQKCHDGTSRPQGPAVPTGHAESGCFLCHNYHAWNTTSAAAPHPGFKVDDLLHKR